MTGSWSSGAVEAIESSLIDAMSIYLGVDSSKISLQSGTNVILSHCKGYIVHYGIEFITFVITDSVDYTSTVNSPQWQENFNSYLASDPTMNTVLGIGTTPSSTNKNRTCYKTSFYTYRKKNIPESM